MHMRIALLGYGNVGRALIALLAEKADVLRDRHNLTVGVTGIMTRSVGGWLAPKGKGISPADVLASSWPKREIPVGGEAFSGGSIAFVGLAPCDALVELTTLDAQTGQPALEHVRRALSAGKSV